MEHINPFLLTVCFLDVLVIVWAVVSAASAYRAFLSRRQASTGVPHYHQDSHGFLHRCYHQSVTVLAQPGFWIGTFAGFPLEHLVWEKLWPFSLLTKFLGL